MIYPESLIYSKPLSRVLDVGCGTGAAIASTIARQGSLVTAVDIAASVVKLRHKAVLTGNFEAPKYARIRSIAHERCPEYSVSFSAV